MSENLEVFLCSVSKLMKSKVIYLAYLVFVICRLFSVSINFSWFLVDGKKIVVFVFLVSFGRVFLIQLQYLKVFCVSRIKKGKG